MGEGKLHILYVIPTLDRGGSELHLIHLSKRFVQMGHAVHIVTLFRQGSCSGLLAGSGVTLTCLDMKSILDAAKIVKLLRLLRTERFDIVHSYVSGFDILCAVPARSAGVPTVIGARREVPLWMKKRHRFARTLGNPFLDRVICCSEKVREYTFLEEHMEFERVTVIRSGVDLDLYRRNEASREEIRKRFRIRAEEVLVVTVANFGEEKGYPVLVEAIGLLPRVTIDRCMFIFVGEGPQLHQVRQRVHAKGLDERIFFAGSMSNVPEVLSGADLFVLSSLSEGLPNVVLEAMAAGLPVVSTRAGGIPEAVDDGKTGILVEAGDPQALSDALNEMVESGELRGRMGINARQRAEAVFSQEEMFWKYREVYVRLAEAKISR